MPQKSRKRKLEGEEQSIANWEQENIFRDETREEMESMWELPQIFHFLHLTKESLNIPHLSMYEMERMLLIPRASKQLANIMTSLLSSPVTKAKLRKIPPMPYEFWTNILAYKIKSWFKVYEGKHQDAVKVLETIGVEPEFWNIFPDAPLLNGKDFEELTFKQKVWLLKTICDTVMHTRKTVQEDIAKQPYEDQFETVLGTDRYGARYIYFPQFLKSDLRIYRHCLDNKILSTVKPIKPKLKTVGNKTLEQSDLMRKRAKHKRKKSRWSNGLPSRSRKRVNKCDEKVLSDCKCTSDSATGSLINEDTNLSSTSTCNNNNNNDDSSNNKNKEKVNLDTINGKRSRSLSKCSEMSTECGKTHCTNVKSSGYDTNTSVETSSDVSTAEKMFKGFSSSSNEKCNIKILSGILGNLKTDPSEGRGTDDVNASSTNTSQNKLELNSVRQYLDTIDLCTGKSESVDNLSSVSKTDDEKLNEIISAESFKLGDKSSSNFHTVRETHQISTISKSDDEKLSETQTGQSTPEDNASLVEETKEHVRYTITKESKGSVEESQLGESSKSRDNEMESENKQDLSLSELRSMLQKEAMEDDLSFDEDSEIGYNLRKTRSEKTRGCKQEVDDFNGMLLELSASKFQLVADSIASLKDLISSFLQKSDSPSVDTDDDNEPIPLCELRLVKKLSDLLESLKEMEPAICDSLKKARAKLQKELANLKEGQAAVCCSGMECQDSSGEGVGSNWWVLGSQGYPLPTSGDAPLQTLPQSTLSPTGAKSNTVKSKECQEEHISRAEDSKHDPQDHKERQGENTPSESQRGEDNSQESTGAEEESKDDSNCEEGQETRRVLRARGVSSYTEQFYSDDEIEENKLEEWSNVEAVYAAPSAQAGASTPYLNSKVKLADCRTNEEDSDQEWILPSSRKRKNKRPSANRRLKSFEHKLQSIKVDELQEAAESMVAAPSTVKNDKEKLAVKEDHIANLENSTDSTKASSPNATENHEAAVENHEPAVENHEAVAENQNLENHEAVVENNFKQIVPSLETINKVENIESVHSELDIKDEGPIYDYTPCQVDNGYTANINANYMMIKTEPNPMNYYVMQPNAATVVSPNTIVQHGSVVSNIVPQMQQGYYVHGGQNYIIQNPQTGYVPPPSLQPQGPQMMAPQQFVNHPGYIPYMMAAPHPPQRNFLPTNSHFLPQNMHQHPPVPTHPNPTQNRYPPPQNRYPPSRPSYPHPNGAVIRSNMPIRGTFPRTNNARQPRNLPQQRVTSAKPAKSRKPSAPSENANQNKANCLIVLSDSDDEIEMIVTKKAGSETGKAKTTPRKNVAQSRHKPTITSNVTVAPPKGSIPQQIIQRMSQGGISITPVKPAQPAQSPNTQLVVVVNDTGSHYALALPNGSKLILTPEQVAQIRASNGGKLIL